MPKLLSEHVQLHVDLNVW